MDSGLRLDDVDSGYSLLTTVDEQLTQRVDAQAQSSQEHEALLAAHDESIQAHENAVERLSRLLEVCQSTMESHDCRFDRHEYEIGYQSDEMDSVVVKFDKLQEAWGNKASVDRDQFALLRQENAGNRELLSKTLRHMYTLDARLPQVMSRLELVLDQMEVTQSSSPPPAPTSYEPAMRFPMDRFAALERKIEETRQHVDEGLVSVRREIQRTAQVTGSHVGKIAKRVGELQSASSLH